jgi:hypothetical protein
MILPRDRLLKRGHDILSGKKYEEKTATEPTTAPDTDSSTALYARNPSSPASASASSASCATTGGSQAATCLYFGVITSEKLEFEKDANGYFRVKKISLNEAEDGREEESEEDIDEQEDKDVAEEERK